MTEFTDGTAKFKVTKSCGILPGTVTAFSGPVEYGYPVDKSTGLVNREWHLCDGTNGTPDLRNRFIYGGDGTTNGATGGEATVTLEEANIPEHRHKQNINGKGTDGWNNKYGTMTTMPKAGGSEGKVGYSAATNGWAENANAVYTDYAGSGTAHNNMPPYYTLAFIMKL